MWKRTDHTPLACLGIVAIAATLKIGTLIPPTQPAPVVLRVPFIECWLFPYLPWCIVPPDPKPIVEPPAPTPDCDFDGPCQQ